MPLYALGEKVPSGHPSAYVHPDATIIGEVIVGAGSSVWPNVVLRGDHGPIVIGARVAVQDGTVVHGNVAGPTRIGDRCIVGHLAHIEGWVIGSRCLVGSGSIVMAEAVIGEGAVVGAGAVVRRGRIVPLPFSCPLSKGVSGRRARHDLLPLSSMIRGVLSPAGWRRWTADRDMPACGWVSSQAWLPGIAAGPDQADMTARGWR